MDVEKELSSINEYNKANEYFKNGQVSRALPLLQFTQQITSTTLKSNCMYDFIVRRKISHAYRYLGKFKEAEMALQSSGDNGVKLEGFCELMTLQSLSACQLLQGNVNDALETASTAIRLAEDNKYEEVENIANVFSPSYGMYGLCLLFMGKYSPDAETYLQMSSRWSSGDLSAQLISGCNLG